MKFHLFLTFCVSLIVYSQQSVYYGTIGNAPIHLELECWGNEPQICKGRYSYDKHLIDIPLDGQKVNNLIKLNSGYFYNEYPKDDVEVISLKENNNQLNGHWQKNNQRFNIKLKLVHTENEYKIELNNYYNQLKVPKIEWIRDSIQKFNEKELVWFNENYSKESLFRLGNGFSKENRNYLNPILDSIHLNQAIFKMECNDWNDVFTKVMWATNSFISWEQNHSVYCGGAHPSYGTQSFNFDLNNKKTLKWFSDFYADDMIPILKEKYKSYQDLQEECSYFKDNIDAWEYASWTISKDGIYITPNFPHVLKPCEEPFFLSYEELGIEPIE